MQSSGAVEKLRRGGRTTFARSPLLQGLLTLRPDALPPSVAAARPWLADLEELLRDYRTDLLTCALTFAATCSGADHVVLGVDSSEQLRQATRSTKADLPAGLARELERRFADVPSQVIDPRQWGDRAS